MTGWTNRFPRQIVVQLFTAILAVGFWVAPAAGVTYYVDKNNAQCSDAATFGTTEARPYCTVRYVTTIARPGDIFLIKNGRYGEGGEFTRSGTAAAPITYRATGPNVSIGSFDDVRDEDFTSTQYANVYSIPWTKTCCSGYAVTQTYFAPILVDDPNQSSFTMIQQDGVMRLKLTTSTTTLSAREGTWMLSGGRIYVHAYGHRVPSTTGTDLVIGHQLNGHMDVGSNTQYNIFDGFTINYAGGTGTPSFSVLGSFNQFFNLKFQGTPWSLRGSNNTAENITVSHVIDRGETWEWHYSGGGTSMSVRGSNHRLKNIHLFHSWNSSLSTESTTGLVVDGLRNHGSPNHCAVGSESTNMILRNFTAYNCQDYLWITESRNLVIEHATVPGGIYLMAEEVPIGGVTVRNSIFGGTWTFDPERSTSITCEWEINSVFENNVIGAGATIKHCVDNRVYPIQDYISRCQSGQLTSCMTIRNNILVTDFRTVLRNGMWNGTMADTWDNHLATNSPAINAGRTSGTTRDIDGVARPQGPAPDSGIYELCTSGTCVQTPPPPTSSACDINRDSITNVMDVQLGVNQALGISACTADINHDGRCDILDVQRVSNAALFGTCLSS